ncbi:hypothetical protein GF415_04985 [Candidatus Micrarchaeota archaeon]|nr:hypothetical protein [Candidatus Micrarchaeota archaeon]
MAITQKKERVPREGKNTLSIRVRRPPELEEQLGSGINARFIAFGNAYRVISRALRKNQKEWRGSEEKTKKALEDAMAVMQKEKEHAGGWENETAFGEYNLLKGFKTIILDKRNLGEFEGWISEKERQYSEFREIYADLGYSGEMALGLDMTKRPEDMHNEVLRRCNWAMNEDRWASETIEDFYLLISNPKEIQGTMYTLGEKEKEMFDSWLRANALSGKREREKKMVGLEEAIAELREGLVQEREARKGLEKRVGQLVAEKEMAEKALRQEQEDSRGLMERVRGLIEENGRIKDFLDEERRRGSRFEELWGKEKAKVAELGEELLRMSEPGIEHSQTALPPEMSPEFEESYREEEAETVVPPEEELAEIVAKSKKEEAVVVESGLPRKEVTEEVPVEELEEIRSGKERGRIRKAITAIFSYGFAGGEETCPKPVKKTIEFPPEHEKEAYKQAWKEQAEEEERFNAAMEEYGKWYNKTGRWIHSRHNKLIGAAGAVKEFYSKNKRRIKIVAAGAVAVGAVAAITAVGNFGFLETEKTRKSNFREENAKPAVAQIAEERTAMEAEKEEQTGSGEDMQPKLLEKPGLEEVLGTHGLELGKNTHPIDFHQSLGAVEDVQERYVVLEELLKGEETLKNYERRYIAGQVLEIYRDFLRTAEKYASLENQPEAEKAGAREAGEMVSERMKKLLRQKRIKKMLGAARVGELRNSFKGFLEFASSLPEKSEIEQEPIEAPVVSEKKLAEMEKNGEVPEAVVIAPDQSKKRPYDMEKRMGKIVGGELEALDNYRKVNQFYRRVNGEKNLEKKFLLGSHLVENIIEYEMDRQMSEKRIISIHLEAMNAAILFAMEDGQSMAAVAEALNNFEAANEEVKRLLGYKRVSRKIGAGREREIQTNLKWLRSRAEELAAKVDAYEKHGGDVLELPGSPIAETQGGVSGAGPEKIKIDPSNEYTAMQVKVFSEHGLSIMEHPLEVYEKIKGKGLNSFDRFIVLENLSERIMNNPLLMEGVVGEEKFRVLDMLGAYLKASVSAANQPKNWRAGVTKDTILLHSNAIVVNDLLKELRKLKKANVPPGNRHLHFPIDQDTFRGMGEAVREFEEQIKWIYSQKPRMRDTNGE